MMDSKKNSVTQGVRCRERLSKFPNLKIVESFILCKTGKIAHFNPGLTTLDVLCFALNRVGKNHFTSFTSALWPQMSGCSTLLTVEQLVMRARIIEFRVISCMDINKDIKEYDINYDPRAKASAKNWLNKLFKFVSREDWGAASPTNGLTPLKIPASFVITTWTETDPCHTADQCKERIRSIQVAHMKTGLPDIQHNFLIGSDGYLYEGRGWEYESPPYPSTVKYADNVNGKFIEVAFIERSENENIPETMQKSLSYIFSMGNSEKKLTNKIDVYYKMDNNDLELVTSHNFELERKKQMGLSDSTEIG